LERELASYIEAHKDQFVKPRQVSTDFGKFGLRTLPPDVLIDDEPALIQRCLDDGYEDCLLVVRKPIKAALKTRLEAGQTLPGARLREGYEEATYTVAKHLIESARTAEGES
jgi:hypothetical protein